MVLIHDHGFGGNYDEFGNDGLLHRIAERTGVFPEYLLVAEDATRPWRGYVRVEGVQPDFGGVHHTPRALYRRTEDG